MLTMTIEQLLKKYSCTEQEIADKVGLTVSMISKLKNGGVSVTEETQKRFYKAFECQIMAPQLRIKRAYEEMMLKYIELEQKYNALYQENKDLKNIINQVKGVIKNV